MVRCNNKNCVYREVCATFLDGEADPDDEVLMMDAPTGDPYECESFASNDNFDDEGEIGVEIDEDDEDDDDDEFEDGENDDEDFYQEDDEEDDE